ncbi:SRPBCC family protein [Paenibacillus sp. N3/727]|uniref:SRPBCC family protein n=1 Tax=Paenibacillus sp. N3/727 TaxID=2925845 RepID=UPI001F52C525|nr:SRPBCC family protein [Paenibacillus sp. N3/727]UNK18904.1 SRPBCC family protein [Paenibacillus sp. N3/727]
MELKYDFYIDANKEQVWNALVSPEGTRSAFFGSVIKSSFVVGEPYQYVGPGAEGDETVHVYGTVLAYEPQQKLSLTEHPGPAYYSNHAELESRITFTLDTVGKCTKLTLVNDNYTPDHPSFSKAGDSWWMILSSIKTFVETGKTMDFGW